MQKTYRQDSENTAGIFQLYNRVHYREMGALHVYNLAAFICRSFDTARQAKDQPTEFE
jgi:hypothetical protein